MPQTGVQHSTLGNYLAEFFAQYPGFEYKPSAGVMSEFWRMCNQFCWEEDVRKEARDALRNAIAQQFNIIYGTDLGDISSWQILCGVLGIDPIPDRVQECRAVVEKIYVNIIDLVDAPETGKAVNIFGTEQELSEYTKETGKYYPRDNAYAGGLLRFLLRHIINPRPEVRQSSSRHRARGNGRSKRGKRVA